MWISNIELDQRITKLEKKLIQNIDPSHWEYKWQMYFNEVLWRFKYWDWKEWIDCKCECTTTTPITPWLILIWTKQRVTWLLNPSVPYPRIIWNYYRLVGDGFTPIPAFGWTWFLNVAEINWTWTIRLVFTLWLSWYFNLSWTQTESNWRAKIHKFRWWVSVEEWGTTYSHTSPITSVAYDITSNVEVWDMFKFEYWVNSTYSSWAYPYSFSHNWECTWVEFYTNEWNISVITIL